MDLSTLTVAQLKEMAKSLRMKGYSRLRKTELINGILAARKAEELGLHLEPNMTPQEVEEEVTKAEFLYDELVKELKKAEPVKVFEKSFPLLNIQVKRWKRGRLAYDDLDRFIAKRQKQTGKRYWLLTGDQILLRYIFLAHRYDEHTFIVNEQDLAPVFAVFEKFERGKRRLSPKPPLDKKYGTIGWDVPFEWPSAIEPKNIPPMPRRNNLPSLTPEGVRFSKCAVDQIILMYMLEPASKAFTNIFRLPLYSLKVARSIGVSAYEGWSLFASYPANTAVLLLPGHAVAIHKVTPQRYILIDSDKRNSFKERQVEKMAERFNIEIKYQDAQGKQQEGSCGMHSVARLMMIALYGEKGIKRPIEPWAAVYTSWLGEVADKRDQEAMTKLKRRDRESAQDEMKKDVVLS